MERESQTIGSLTSKIGSSLDPSESKLRELRPASGTIGGQNLVRVVENSTGRQLGETGAERLLSERLQGADAWVTDKALIASLPQPVRSRLKSKVNNDFDLVGYDLVAGAMHDDIGRALGLVDAACAPADRTVVLTEVTKCFAVTTAREHDETDMKATLAGMVDGLREFPADVIRDACRSYAKCHKWRPSLSELREFCWPRFRARENLRAVFRRAPTQGSGR